MNYMALIINENINSGLLLSQFIKPIQSIKNNNIKIINIHKVGVKNKVYENSINIPFAIPYRLFMFNCLFFLTPIIAFLYALILYLIVERNTVLLSRGYFPSLVALILSKIKRIEYIIDTRSLFIDENTINGNLKKNSVNYKMWRYFEKKILCNSKKTIAVSLKQKDFYEKICHSVQIELIPCYVSSVNHISKTKQLELRKELGFASDDIVVAYYGSLNDGWNSIDMYSDFFKECSQKGYKVLVISQDYISIVDDNRMQIDNVVLIDTTKLNFSELLEYLQIADYGVVLMKKAADWETRLSVKFVEYLNAGLQVIVGEYVGEAIRYAKEKFADRAIVYSSIIDLNELTHKKEYDNTIVSDLFGYKNIRKIIY